MPTDEEIEAGDKELLRLWREQTNTVGAFTESKLFVIAILEAAEKVRDEWQPIETAPQDGTVLFLWTGNSEFPTRWQGSWRNPDESELWVNGSEEPCEKEGTFDEKAGWFADEFHTFKLQGDYYPTDWMHPPQPPKEKNSAEK